AVDSIAMKNAAAPRHPEPRETKVAGIEQLFIRNLPIGCMIKDADGRIVYINEHARRLFAPPEGLPEHATLASMFPPDVVELLLDGDRRVLATGEVVTTPVWLPDNLGGRRHVAMFKFPVDSDGRRLVGGIAVDISPFSSNVWDASTHQQILDAITDLVLVKGPKSRLLWANRAFLNAYGMSNAQLQGLVDAPFVEPDLSDRYVQDDMRVFATGETLDIPEEPMQWDDGQVRIVHTVKSPIFGEDGSVKRMVAVIRDITDRKRLESELLQAQKLESIGRLAAGMAHEINTPIQFIGDQRTFAESAFDDLMGLVGRYQGFVARVAEGSATAADVVAIREAEEAIDLPYLRTGLVTAFADMADGIGRVAQLVKALKEFGYPDHGVHEPADINAAIRRTTIVATNEYRYLADLELDLAEIPLVPCNVSELQQVVLNLLVNAAHAIADSGSARGVIRVSTRTLNHDVIITISDTGCGIPEAIQNRVFDPFFTTKSVGRGTGQGLSIARMLMDKQHGSIKFDTTPGKGTTFHLRMPLAVTEPPVAVGAA
ncbi:MAG: PAS domain-containing protein, partial [Kofleriaceae bacterium]